jgi:hypothetical protein
MFEATKFEELEEYLTDTYNGHIENITYVRNPVLLLDVVYLVSSENPFNPYFHMMDPIEIGLIGLIIKNRGLMRIKSDWKAHKLIINKIVTSTVNICDICNTTGFIGDKLRICPDCTTRFCEKCINIGKLGIICPKCKLTLHYN